MYNFSAILMHILISFLIQNLFNKFAQRFIRPNKVWLLELTTLKVIYILVKFLEFLSLKMLLTDTIAILSLAPWSAQQTRSFPFVVVPAKEPR